jgi:hypothetical protein
VVPASRIVSSVSNRSILSPVSSTCVATSSNLVSRYHEQSPFRRHLLSLSQSDCTTVTVNCRVVSLARIH